MKSWISLAAIIIFISAMIGNSVSRVISNKKSIGNSAPQYNFKRTKRNAEFQKILKFFKKPPTSVTLLSGSSRVLECEVGGFPSPIVYWLKNGKKIDEDSFSSDDVINDDEEVYSITMVKSRLYLDCVTSADEGEYTCVVENAYEKKSKNVIVEVMETENDLCLDKTIGSPAKINLWTTRMLKTQGYNVRLLCRSEGFPKPKITWLDTEENPISDNFKYKVMENGDLIIYDLTWNDMGTYTCLSENSRGSDTVNLFLYPVLPESNNKT